MNVNFTGYLPDADPTTPGVIVDCESLLPTQRGMESAPSAISAGAAALSAACYGAALCTKLDNTYRVFAGTLTKLYEMSSTTWTDRTRAVGGDYTTSTSSRWRFAQFGNTSLACNGADLLQSSSSGAFANIAGAPIPRCMGTVENFVMLGGVDLGGGAGMEYDRWICSAFDDATDWTPDVTTQCTTGRLVSAPGPITAVRNLGSNIVIYKERAIYFGTYQGAGANVWRFEKIPGQIGAACQEAVINFGSVHLIVGYEDIYLFDGSRPVAIGDGVKKAFFAELNPKYRDRVIGSHDFTNNRIRIYYPTTSSSVDSCLVYDYKANKWGRDDRSIESALEYLTGQVTYSNIGNYFADYAAINVSYDSPFWTNNSPVDAIFDTSHTLYTLTGTSSSSSLTTGDIGEDTTYTLLLRATPRFVTDPTTCTMTNYYKSYSGGSWTTDSVTTMANGKCDVMRSDSWHRLKYAFTGDVEIAGHDVQLMADGEK